MKKESRQIHRERQTTLRADGTTFSNSNEEFIRAQINHSALKLDIQTKNVPQTLAELRRIVECLNIDEDLEDLTSFELRTMLSDEFMNNQAAVSEIRRLLGNEQQYRIVKEMVQATQELDFIAGKKSLKLDPNDIKAAVLNLVAAIDPNMTKHALIHIKGQLEDNDRIMIVDRIHQSIAQAQIKAYQSNTDIDGKALIEAVFFGDFEPFED